MTEPKNDGCGAIRAMQHELSQRRKILVSRGLADLSRPQEFAVGKPNEQGDILEAARSGNFARVKTILALRPSDVAMRGRYNLTPLHLAAENGHFNVVKLLLDYGAEIDAKGNIGQTPLLSAAEGGYAEVADILIAGGADITAETTSQRSILYAAAGGGLLKLVQAIAAKGIDVNTPWYGSSKRTAIHQAAENGRADVVRFLLAEGANVLSLTGYGWTPLSFAAIRGHREVIELLIHHGTPVDYRHDLGKPARRLGWTPFLLAADGGHQDAMDVLIAHGADVETVADDGSTLFRAAIRGGLSEIVQDLLLRGSDANELVGSNGRTVLHEASMRGWHGIASALMANGANVHTRDENGQTPLHLSNTGEVVDILVKNGADVDAIDSHDRTPLHELGSVSVAQALLKNGAFIDAVDVDNRTPLYIAVENGEDDVVEYFLQNGADVNVRDVNGQTPLDHCSDSVAKILLENGADVNVRGVDGQTPLFHCRSETKAKILLAFGAQPDAIDKSGKTPLDHLASSALNLYAMKVGHLLAAAVGNLDIHVAAGLGMIEAVRKLIRLDTEAVTSRKHGDRALHWAVRNGQLEVVKLLVEFGAAVEARDCRGRTALFEAIAHCYTAEREELIRFLIEVGASVHTTKDIFGRTAVDCLPRHLRVRLSSDLISLLQKHGLDVEQYSN